MGSVITLNLYIKANPKEKKVLSLKEFNSLPKKGKGKGKPKG